MTLLSKLKLDINTLNPTICRRMLTLHLIDSLEKPDTPALEAVTGWPRRTLQDIIAKGLPGHGCIVEFVQQGVRNNDGYHRVLDWGSFNQLWVAQHLQDIKRALELT